MGVNPPKRPKSESCLDRVADHCELRKSVRSAPTMDSNTYNDGFLVPPTPTQMSVWSRSFARTECSNHTCATAAVVQNPSYRRNNLDFNGVHIPTASDELPDHIIPHVTRLETDRHSPELPPEELRKHMHRLGDFEESCNHKEMGRFVEDALLPSDNDDIYGERMGLKYIQSALTAVHLVPRNLEIDTSYRISQPKPDYLYGYPISKQAFTIQQRMAQHHIDPTNPPSATFQPSLAFPFLAIEVKADDGTATGGSLWIATDEAAGAAAACLNASD